MSGDIGARGELAQAVPGAREFARRHSQRVRPPDAQWNRSPTGRTYPRRRRRTAGDGGLRVGFRAHSRSKIPVVSMLAPPIVSSAAPGSKFDPVLDGDDVPQPIAAVLAAWPTFQGSRSAVDRVLDGHACMAADSCSAGTTRASSLMFRLWTSLALIARMPLWAASPAGVSGQSRTGSSTPSRCWRLPLGAWGLFVAKKLVPVQSAVTFRCASGWRQGIAQQRWGSSAS